MSAPATAMGVDIGNGAWAVVEFDIPTTEGEVNLKAACVPLRSIVDWAPARAAAVVVIDIPIGLLRDSDASPTKKGLSGDRNVDRGARKWCPSPSSVFPPPTQQQLRSAVVEHRRASTARHEETSRRILGNVQPGGMSRQTFELVPAIDGARQLKEALPDRVFESHPEVVLSALAGGILPFRKTSLAGALARAGVLQARLCVDVVSWAIRREFETRVAADNWLDALAMALVATDWARNRRQVLKTRDGRVHLWNGEADGIMALPSTMLMEAPKPLQEEIAMRLPVTNQHSFRRR
jgi:predicted RNase H-like nuclease